MVAGRRIIVPGLLVRRLLGDRVFARVVDVYRAIFVNLDEVAACIPLLPDGAELLDVGGGDGALLERLLQVQPHVRATLVDQSASVGLSLREWRRDLVRLLAVTSVRECAAHGVPRPYAVVISDVLHHIPPTQRLAFLREIADFTGPRPKLVIVKEVAPQGWRARLGLLSDRYVTGDRHTALLTVEETIRMVGEVFPQLVPRHTPLAKRDAPNYCVLFEPPGEAHEAQHVSAPVRPRPEASPYRQAEQLSGDDGLTA